MIGYIQISIYVAEALCDLTSKLTMAAVGCGSIMIMLSSRKRAAIVNTLPHSENHDAKMSSKWLRWLGTVVTSHTVSNRQAYTPLMSMLQRAVQSTHCTSCNQPARTNAIMLHAVKFSLYVVGPFLCRILHKSWSTGVKM